MMERPEIISLPKVKDVRGSLSFTESFTHVPFDIRRVYYIYDVPGGESRGEHAHKALNQLFIAVSGGFFVDLDDGLGYKQTFYLSRPDQGLLLPKGYWRKLYNFTSGAVCLVLASEVYDETDYIRDYHQFIHEKQTNGHSLS